MCGRYRLTTKAKSLSELFDADFDEWMAQPALKPRFNVAPTDQMPVVRIGSAVEGQPARRTISSLRWGLVPFWSKDLSGSARMINARAETVFEKAAFKDSLRRRRCLVPADGFYEWKTLPGTTKKPKKQPLLFCFDDDRPFALAGLWARWKGPPGVVETFTILTTAANELVAPVHDRMPVIVDPADYQAWLDPDNEDVDVARLAEPHPILGFQMRLVSSKVGNVKNDDESVLVPDRLIELPFGPSSGS